jgi:hypothetical protein
MDLSIGLKRTLRMWQMEGLKEYICSAETIDYVSRVLAKLVKFLFFIGVKLMCACVSGHQG